MQDLLLWKRLQAPLSPHTHHTLASLLHQLADLSKEEKTFYLGELIQLHATQTTSELHSALLTFLGGAQGPMIWPLFVEALHLDPPLPITPLLRAFRQSCNHDPGRWIHALFHPNPQIRKEALAQQPENFPLRYELLLFPDPAHQETLLQKLEGASLQTGELITLLQLHQAEYIESSFLRAILPQILHHPHQVEVLLRALPHTSLPTSYLPPDPDALWRQYTQPSSTPELLETLFAVLWDAHATHTTHETPKEHTLSLLLRTAQTLLGQHKLLQTQHLRIALALLRVGAKQERWTEEAVFLILSAFPKLFGTRYLPLALRQKAARQLIHVRSPLRLHDPLAEWIDTPLCYRPDGSFDLAVIAGLMSLDKTHPFQHLLSHLRPQTLFEAVIQHPEGAVMMLRLEPRSPIDKLGYDALLGLLLQKAQDSKDFVVYALLHLPNKSLEFLCQQLSEKLKTPDDLFAQLAETFSSTAPMDGRKQRKLTQLCALLARTIGIKNLRASLHLLAQYPESPFCLELLEQLSRCASHETLAHKIAQLPLRALRTTLSLIQEARGFSLDAEEAVCEALQNHPDLQIQHWLQMRQQGRLPLDTELRQRIDTTPQLLPEASLHRIARCSEADLEEALDICFDLPGKGLCRALQKRRHSTPHPQVLVALLLCHDPLHLVLEQWMRFSDESSELYEQLEKRMASRCPTMKSLSTLGLVWMHRWEFQRKTFEKEFLVQKGGLLRLLQEGLQIPIAPLRWRYWLAASSLLKTWRWRKQDHLQQHFSEAVGHLLLAVVTLGQAAQHVEPRFFYDETLQDIAAEMLVTLYKTQRVQEMMLGIQGRIMPFLSNLPEEVRRVLREWISDQGLALGGKVQNTTHPKQLEAMLYSIQSKTSPKALAIFCLENQPQLVEASALKMIEAGEEGLRHLLPLLLPSTQAPPQLRKLLQLVALWESGPSLQSLRSWLEKQLQQLDQVEENTFHPAPFEQHERCFLLLLAFAEREDRDLLVHLPKLLRAPTAKNTQAHPQKRNNTTVSWFREDDWEKLEQIGYSKHQRAVMLAPSDQYTAYAQAVQELLDALPIPPTNPSQMAPEEEENTSNLQKESLDALEDFLLCGKQRFYDLRLQAARCLSFYQRELGWPLLFHEALYRAQDCKQLYDLLVHFSAEQLEALAKGLLLNNAHREVELCFLRAIEKLPLQNTQKEKLAHPFLLHSTHRQTQELALTMHAPHPIRAQKLQELAKICSWGIQIGRQLTGKVFQIRLITGRDLGYTRLETPRIFINPLPILRQEKRGAEILKGLILHEIGHHIYHATPAARALWKQATQEGTQPLLNLVADEHLERNLRAQDEEFGNVLKILAAYGFQHNQRELPAFFLLDQLGPLAFSALTGSPPTPARAHGHVRAHTGALLRDVERQGLSFSRFMRALRMGLGNRFRDPLVAKALNLFNKDFKHLEMEGLYQISLKLRDLFQHQIQLLEHLDTELTLGADISEIFSDSEGLRDEELQRAIEEELSPQKHAFQKTLLATDARALNLSKDIHFQPIYHIQHLLYSAEQAQQYTQQILRESRKLRDYLHKLGLRLQPQRRRIQGHHIDKSALRAAILRGDPRFLTARKLLQHTDLFLGVLIDCSGSMNGDYLEKAKAFSSLIADSTVHLEGIDARFFGFNDTTLFDAGDARRCAVHALKSEGGNNDAAAMFHMAKLATLSRRKSRLIIMISDGSPTECSVTALTALVQRITQKMHILCAQVAVRPLPSVSFTHYVELTDDDLQTSVHRFGQLIAKLVLQALKAS